jgi:hypothetical protein
MRHRPKEHNGDAGHGSVNVKPERATENVELVRVYDEQHDAWAAGLRYATFQLKDGVSFVLSSRPRMDTTRPRGPGLPPLLG